MATQLEIRQALKALHAAAVPLARLMGFDRDESRPTRGDAGGVILVEMGEAQLIDTDLSPLTYYYELSFTVQLMPPTGMSDDHATEWLAATAGAIGAAIVADRYLGDRAEWVDTATQGLNSTQQTNARTNIAALPVANPVPTGNITFNSNNTPILRQYNAALSATLNLPYVNSGNGYTFDRDIYLSAGSVSTNPLGIQSLLTLVGTSGFTTGARMVYLNTNAVTGSVTGFEAEISASTRFEGFRVRNTNASGVSGGRILGNGNLYLDFFNEVNFHRWALRLKTDGNFTIGQSNQGSDIADALRINFTSLQTSFLYPPKLPSYTVAGLPSTTTYGVGSEAFASNGRRAGEGAGAGTGCPVWSDGTNWRTFYDNSIVAA